ncbi:MAG: alpha-glucuronidase [Prevotella sp.]|nr:alpha-glucuronidase [Prevotella sp.]
MHRLCYTFLALLLSVAAWAEDGSRLWLRMTEGKNTQVTGPACTATDEMRKYWKGGELELLKVRGYGPEDYTIACQDNKTTVAASTDAGLLYGAFELLRMQQTGADMRRFSITSSPTYKLRLLNHWDNPNGTVERGFAGHSIFWPETDNARLLQYARANASIGINGTVLNNVNAKPQALASENLQQVKHIADILRPYNIRVYLSVNFASPIHVGGLKTADPLDKEVRAWWKKKVDEIYALVPDFGGFLVKANSEGEPGPCDFGRSHADGANMMADALKRHEGIVMWRAFVYNPQDKDRAKQAYNEFMPLDGQFRPNVILQVKNGPVDFQPREPYSPLFTAIKKTSLAAELQVTQEYLGAANHLVFLAPMWQEFFSQFEPGYLDAVAGVANIGDDTNWCGHHFAQANWYAFGRLAWSPTMKSEQIADEWLRQTFTCDQHFLNPMKKLMVESHETCVNYMMPLGLHHIFAGTHHYGPEPWYSPKGLRADWTPPYYHQANSEGLGFDRTHNGTDAVSQYPKELCEQYNDINTCPEKYLAWFHHVPWQHRMHSGRTFWDELCHKYADGVTGARQMLAKWDAMKEFVDEERFNDIQRRLRIQARDSEWWRDACLLYFQQFSNLPIPQDMEHPVHNLDEMMQFRIPIGMYENPVRGYTQ